MKVRWTSESLRLRITPSELAALLAGDMVRQSAPFPGGWVATLAPGPATRCHSTAPGRSDIELAPEDLASLADPTSEGVYPTVGGLRLIVEKDFPCVHPRASAALEHSETFPAPEGFAERKA